MVFIHFSDMKLKNIPLKYATMLLSQRYDNALLRNYYKTNVYASFKIMQFYGGDLWGVSYLYLSF